MIRGKKGFIRILEVFIAISIISGAMIFIYIVQIQRPNEEEEIHQLQRLILEEITRDPTLRAAVVEDNDEASVKLAIEGFIPSEYEYDLRICALNTLCSLNQVIGKEVFSDETTVSSTLNQYSPKVVKIFIWKE